jgi:hypothetical protein
MQLADWYRAPSRRAQVKDKNDLRGAPMECQRFILRSSGPGDRAGETVMKADQLTSSGRNRLLAALLPADFALLSPHLKDLHSTKGSCFRKRVTPLSRFIFPKTE